MNALMMMKRSESAIIYHQYELFPVRPKVYTTLSLPLAPLWRVKLPSGELVILDEDTGEIIEFIKNEAV